MNAAVSKVGTVFNCRISRNVKLNAKNTAVQFWRNIMVQKKWIYICSIFLAIIGVIFSVIPYVILERIAVKLLDKEAKNCIFYLKTADLWLCAGFFTVSVPYVPTLRLSMRLLVLASSALIKVPECCSAMSLTSPAEALRTQSASESTKWKRRLLILCLSLRQTFLVLLQFLF